MSILVRVLLISVVFFLSSCQSDTKPPVPIDCAHDRVHAEQILDLFEAETGIRVDAIFDTEANKTVGLAERLRAERERPRCDVHWSNEPLRSVRLSHEGLFRKMPSDLGAAIPEMWKDKSGLWCGFAGRVRVLAVQPTSPAGEWTGPVSMKQLTEDQWLGKVALADPRFGTTGSHLAIIRSIEGKESYLNLLEGLQMNDVQLVSSNSASRDRVLAGEAWIGVTDTDDIEVVRRRGESIGEVFLSTDGDVLLPNVIALVKGSPNPTEGEILARWLLSSRVEELLAASSSRQVPLIPGTSVPVGGLSIEDLDPLVIDWDDAADALPAAIQEAERYLLDR